MSIIKETINYTINEIGLVMLQLAKVKKILLFVGVFFISSGVISSESLLLDDKLLLEKSRVLIEISHQNDDVFYKISKRSQEGLNLLDEDFLGQYVQKEKDFDYYSNDFEQKMELQAPGVLNSNSQGVFGSEGYSKFFSQRMAIVGLSYIKNKGLTGKKHLSAEDSCGMGIFNRVMSEKQEVSKKQEKIELYHDGNLVSVMGVEAQKIVEKYKLHMGMQDTPIDLYVSEHPRLLSGRFVGGYATSREVVLSKGLIRYLLSSDFKRHLFAKYFVFHELTHIKHQHLQYIVDANSKHRLQVKNFLNFMEKFLRYHRTHQSLLDRDDIDDEIENIKAFFAEDIYLQQSDISLFFKFKFAKKTEAIKEIFHRLDIIGECLHCKRFERAQKEIDIITQHLYTLAREVRNDWTRLLIEFEADANAMLQLQCYKCVEMVKDWFVIAVNEGRHAATSISGSIVDCGGYFDYEAFNDLIWCLKQQGCLCEHHQRNYKLYDLLMELD